MSTQVQRRDTIIGSTVVAVGTTPTVLCAVNLNRVSLIIQNVGTVPVFVYFGAGASTSQYSLILAGGVAVTDGTGGVFSEDIVTLTNQITAAVTTGTCNVVVTEI